uniref:Vesicular, overexpressed in cancer, prosurvival protein 1 n=1 Tax=Graphocephala atropunctata TaxID=36148 RepID=A0A1B6L3Q1_9HEMI
MLSGNCVLSATALLLVFTTSGVHGIIKCESSGLWPPDYSFCTSDEYCCGDNNLNCCSYIGNNSMDAVFGAIILLIIFVGCPYMCYCCCCRRTTSRGIVYGPAGTTTAVTVGLPSQGVQQVPYPTVVPYHQQTPYPPQYPANPYYGAPPPAYGLPTQAGVEQASAPPAPAYAQS